MRLLQFGGRHILLNPVALTNNWVPNYILWLHSPIVKGLMFCIGAASCPAVHPSQTRTVTALCLETFGISPLVYQCVV